jgi:DNA-directed RNA polymerase specialized sigma24 family protein
MSELSPLLQQKKDWTLTPAALGGLLAWLDEGTNSDGLRYEEMRRRLVSYFDRKNCRTPNELADETLNRVARRLEEEGVIESETPAKYCYIVARFIFMEHLRDARKGHALFDDSQSLNSGVFTSSETEDDRERKEKMLDCLEQCTGKLQPKSREIITRYYVGTGRTKIETRGALAKELGITMNALSIRACRIRDKLEACVRQCATVESK